MFFIPLTGGGCLCGVRSGLVTANLADHEEFFGDLNGDFSRSGTHATDSARLEFAVFVLTVVIHADAPL